MINSNNLLKFMKNLPIYELKLIHISHLNSRRKIYKYSRASSILKVYFARMRPVNFNRNLRRKSMSFKILAKIVYIIE